MKKAIEGKRKKKEHFDKMNMLEREGNRKTRPDTWPPVADGWAGAEMRVFTLSNSIITDGPTDQRRDKASYNCVSAIRKVAHMKKNIL